MDYNGKRHDLEAVHVWTIECDLYMYTIYQKYTKCFANNYIATHTAHPFPTGSDMQLTWTLSLNSWILIQKNWFP